MSAGSRSTRIIVAVVLGAVLIAVPAAAVAAEPGDTTAPVDPAPSSSDSILDSIITVLSPTTSADSTTTTSADSTTSSDPTTTSSDSTTSTTGEPTTTTSADPETTSTAVETTTTSLPAATDPLVPDTTAPPDATFPSRTPSSPPLADSTVASAPTDTSPPPPAAETTTVAPSPTAAAGSAQAAVPASVPLAGLVASGVPADVVLDTIRTVESDGRYEIGPNRAGASGAYQYIPSTWAGYGGYAEAYQAPAEVQDERARADVEHVLATFGGDVAMVPVLWYFPLAVTDPSWMDRVPNPAGGNRLTVRQYQNLWLATYQAKLATYAPAPLPPAHPDGEVRSIAFPVLGPISYSNDWGACRDGCTRHHEGNDLIGVRMQPLLAATDGTVTRARLEAQGKAGAIVTITDADGWTYNYFHVNNDTPASDDGWAEGHWQVPGYLQVGDQVKAGQIIGYMGDSGNAEGSVPHLHFEIRRPGGVPVNPFPSLQAAQQRQQCAIGIGPWATPLDPNATVTPGVTIEPLFGDGAWNIDPDGRVTATGDAALIEPGRDLGCPSGPEEPFGTGAAGAPATDQTEPALPEIGPQPSEWAEPAVEAGGRAEDTKV